MILRAEKHLLTYPLDIRARNNLAEALTHQGELTQALKILDETLNLAPHSFFARAARCRLAYFQGLTELCREDAEQLKTLQPRLVSDLSKAAQTFAFIGDDDGVRWAYDEAAKRKWLDDPSFDVAALTSLFATCLARAGDMTSAKSHWQHAVKLAGSSTMANVNLDDLRKPPGEQWGPAYFSISAWLSKKHLEELREFNAVAKRSAANGNGVLTESTRRFLTKYPEVERSIPDMLDRGDEACQTLALYLAFKSQHPAVKAALVTYVQGPRGTDQIRTQYMSDLTNKGHRFESPSPFYSKGKMVQIEMISFKVTDEPSVPRDRTDETCDLLIAANEALYDRDGVKAERLLRKALQLESDEPDVLNNLALALALQGRQQESDTLIDEVISKYPTYFFARITVANRKIIGKQYDEARDMLVELQKQETLHYTEFYALAKAWIYCYVGKHEIASAQYWLDMLKHYAPDYPEIPALERHITGQNKLRQLFKQMLSS